MTDRERRLDAIREEARATGRVDAPGTLVRNGPVPPAAAGYYGLPLLKAPVWTWEVPAYFAAGGIAGMAAALAAVAELAGGRPALAADARLVALAGAIVSPLLLISDLGRPARFLNMLRVFKPQSPMSVGAWTLVAFSAAAFVSWLLGAPQEVPILAAGRLAASIAAAVFGLLLAAYTGVLLGVTTVPVWAAHARLLPIHFAGSSLGAATGVLELAGHRDPALTFAGAGAALVVLACAVATERDRRPVSRPLRRGASGALVRVGDLLAGALALALRIAALSWPALRLAAGAAAVAGSVCARYGWVAAGRASAADAGVILDEKSR